MAEMKSHTGGCHCGTVRFEVETDLARVIACNCSICSKTGWLLTFVPPEQFTVVSGADEVAEYQFGKKRVHHFFCPRCGIHPFSRGTAPDGRDTRAVNVRCLDGVDVDTLTVTRFDGKSL